MKKYESALLGIITDLNEGQKSLRTEMRAMQIEFAKLRAEVAGLRQEHSPAASRRRYNSQREAVKRQITRMAGRRGISFREAYHQVYEVFASLFGFDPLDEAAKTGSRCSGLDIVDQRGRMGDLLFVAQAHGRN